MSSKDNDEESIMHSRIDNIELMIKDKEDDVMIYDEFHDL